MYRGHNAPGNDIMSPTSTKRRVLQVERTTGPLSPMMTRHRIGGDLPRHSYHGSIMRPPLSPGSDDSPTISVSKGKAKRSQPISLMQRGSSHGESSNSTMESTRSRSPVLRRPPSPTNSFTSIIMYKSARNIILGLIHLGPLFQLLLMFMILLLVLQSHHHANYAEQQLLRYREAESSMLLQLQKIERNSIKLHKNIRTRLERAGVETAGDEATEVLGAQASELHVMSQELHGQVMTLQESIQDDARASIIEEYGEGPVKLSLDVQIVGVDPTTSNVGFSSSPDTRLDILLWPDTPHATWAILEQVSRHVWDGAVFHLNPNQALLEISPSRPDPLGRGKLDFAEYIPNHPNWHGAWTVGVREEPGTGSLELFVNLQDNAEYQEHETCVGRVIGGFSTLQRVLDATRKSNEIVPGVMVRQASAMHVTKRELGMKL